ncbi:MAG: hypothetical protein ACI9YH_001000 [Colwellia sp.]|jgi:hypothetical protein
MIYPNSKNHTPVEKQVKTLSLYDKQRIRRYSPYILTSSFIASIDDWRVNPASASPVAQISALQGLCNEGAYVIELHHPDRHISADYMMELYFVVLSNGPAEYYVVKSSSSTDGTELDTHLLPTLSRHGYHYDTLSFNAMLACQKAIEASTKLSARMKRRTIKQIKSDHAYILNFIKQATSSPTTEHADWLSIQTPKVSTALLNNSMYYWGILSDHKACDFDFKKLE